MRKFGAKLLEVLRKGDMVLLALCVLTSVFGIVMVAASTAYDGSSRYVIIQTGALITGGACTALLVPAAARGSSFVRRRACAASSGVAGTAPHSHGCASACSDVRRAPSYCSSARTKSLAGALTTSQFSPKLYCSVTIFENSSSHVSPKNGVYPHSL